MRMSADWAHVDDSKLSDRPPRPLCDWRLLQRHEHSGVHRMKQCGHVSESKFPAWARVFCIEVVQSPDLTLKQEHLHCIGGLQQSYTIENSLQLSQKLIHAGRHIYPRQSRTDHPRITSKRKDVSHESHLSHDAQSERTQSSLVTQCVESQIRAFSWRCVALWNVSGPW